MPYLLGSGQPGNFAIASAWVTLCASQSGCFEIDDSDYNILVTFMMEPTSNIQGFS